MEALVRTDLGVQRESSLMVRPGSSRLVEEISEEQLSHCLLSIVYLPVETLFLLLSFSLFSSSVSNTDYSLF